MNTIKACSPDDGVHSPTDHSHDGPTVAFNAAPQNDEEPHMDDHSHDGPTCIYFDNPQNNN